ncbi:MAG: hypothetical protein KC656_10425 [Myxococcales bacterium]|nr:hypothetical protein [Myxococcales bacterium]
MMYHSLLFGLAALAGPDEAARLDAAAARMDAWVYTDGVVHHAGHGPRPGHVRDLPVRIEADGDCVRWVGEGWDEAVYFGHGVWIGPPWEPSPAPDRERLVRWAARPSLWLRWAAREPQRLAADGEDVLWGFSDGLARIHLTEDDAWVRWEVAHPVFGPVTQELRWTPERLVASIAEADTRWTLELQRGEPVSASCPEPPARVEVTRLEDGLYEMAVPEADSRVLLAVNGAEGVLFDAPLSSAVGEALWQTATGLAPDVRTWSVVVSHHHPHYTGGLRPWVAHGATVFVHPELKGWLHDQLVAPRPLEPGGRPKLKVARTGTSLLDGLVELRAIDGASGHTDAFVVSLVKLGPPTVYVADLGRRRADGEVRVRGTWPTDLGSWEPEWVFSGFPLAGPARFPFAEARAAVP